MSVETVFTPEMFAELQVGGADPCQTLGHPRPRAPRRRPCVWDLGVWHFPCLCGPTAHKLVLQVLMTEAGWDVAGVTAAWEADYKSRNIISGFMKARASRVGVRVGFMD